MKRKFKREIKRQVRNYGYYWLTGIIVTFLVSRGLIQQSGISYRVVRTLLRLLSF